jgi:hypothetical protein
MNEAGIDISSRRPKGFTDADVRVGRSRRDDGLRRRVPVLPGQGVRRLEPSRPGCDAADEVRALRDEIARRVAELAD